MSATLTSTRRIPVSGPWITDLEVDYVADAARNAWQEHASLYHDRFEDAFSKYVGTKYALALPSCTSAIHLALAALGIGPGDEVIIPESTWIASAAPVFYLGATPVFADIDPARWCLDPVAFKLAITDRTRAVIVVDLYGNMPDWAAIRETAGSHNIPIIEDAAQAIGARQHDQSAGSFGLVGTFSFHGSKTMTTGEGGMLVTDDADLLARCRILRDHGRPPGDRFFQNETIGFKYRMSSMQAAMGLAQIERIEELVARKREILEWYAQRLTGHPLITLNHEPEGDRIAAWMVTAIISPSSPLRTPHLMALLDAAGIDTRPFFHPLSSLPACTDHPQATTGPTDNPIAYDIAPRGINLPSGMQLTREDVNYVCDALITALDDAAASAH